MDVRVVVQVAVRRVLLYATFLTLIPEVVPLAPLVLRAPGLEAFKNNLTLVAEGYQ